MLPNDPYGRDSLGVADPANNLITIGKDDDNDIACGVKALRITNKTAEFQFVMVVTMTNDEVIFEVPPSSVWIEPLRIRRLKTTTGDVEVHGYTDAPVPDDRGR